ncbi:MAG: YaiI/YqxD family protein [Pseudomonadota bacterium]
MGSRIFIDADACPVREETYRVARRHGVPVTVVANQWLRTPPDVTFQRVSDDFDAADDWIAQEADARTVVITSDILLADRCLKAGARVLAPTGREMDDATIGGQIAVRAIMTDLRDSLATKGAEPGHAGGPAPFTARDRSRFLEALHLMLERMRRG